MSNSRTPLYLLSAVLGFSVVVTSISLPLKLLVLCVVLAVYFFSRSLRIRQLAKTCYGFRYLFLSIAVLNVVFSPNDLRIALDKTLLLFLMLAAVNAYIQVQSRQNIIVGLNLFLKPLRVFGIDTNKSAQLIGATINSVEYLQAMQNNIHKSTEPENAEPVSNKSRINRLINSLVQWILEIEKHALNVDRLDSYPQALNFKNTQ